MWSPIVVGIDMALGDELGPKLSSLGYLTGTLYDPGSYAQFRNARERRNYLHVAIRTTYLALELHEKKDVRRALRGWAPTGCRRFRGKFSITRLNGRFAWTRPSSRITNLLWQEKHLRNVAQFFGKPRERLPAKSRARPSTANAGLVRTRDPEEWVAPYLAIEAVFDAFGL